jgi:mannosyltransferase
MTTQPGVDPATVPATPGVRPDRDTARVRLVRLIPSLVPAVLMLGVGLVGAGRPVLSWDEATTADVARRSAGEIWRLLHNVDAVFGPYYLLMYGWTRLVGHSEVDLRLPSIVAMAAAVGVAGEVGRRLFGPRVGLLAGLILCVLPNSSRYAAEARPYALTCLLSAVAILLLPTALERGRAWRWIAYGGAVVLLGLSHLVALTTLVAHAAVVFYDRRRRGPSRRAARWVVVLAVAAVVLLPIAWVATGQRDVQLAWVDPLTLGGLYHGPGAIVGSVPTAWLLVGLALFARWRPAGRLVVVAVWALAPLVVVAAVSVLVSPLWVARYLLVVLAPAAILAAVAVTGAAAVRLRPVRVLWLGGVLMLLAATAYPGQAAVRAATAKNGPDYRSIARIVDDRQRPGDAVVYETGSRALRAGTEYYLRRYPTSPRDVLLRRPAAEAAQLRADEYPDAAARLAGVNRVWLIVGGNRADPTTEQPALRSLLHTAYERIGLWRPNRATVALYRARPAR